MDKQTLNLIGNWVYQLIIIFFVIWIMLDSIVMHKIWKKREKMFDKLIKELQNQGNGNDNTEIQTKTSND